MKKFLYLLAVALPLFGHAQRETSNNILVTGPKLLDDRQSIFTAGASRPYTSTNEANNKLQGNRAVGLTVLIGTPSNFAEYWYVGNVNDTSLKLKTAASGGGYPAFSMPAAFNVSGSGTANIVVTATGSNATQLIGGGGGLVLMSNLPVSTAAATAIGAKLDTTKNIVAAEFTGTTTKTLTLTRRDGQQIQASFTDQSGGGGSFDTSVLNLNARFAQKISGPSSAGDNILPRFDGTTGKLVKSSGIQVTDVPAMIMAGGYGDDNFYSIDWYSPQEGGARIKLDKNGLNNSNNYLSLTSNKGVYISGTSGTGVTINNLSGSGTRMVVADATGALATQAIPSGGGSSTKLSNSGNVQFTTFSTDSVRADFAFNGKIDDTAGYPTTYNSLPYRKQVADMIAAAGGGYTLPTASASVLGGVKVGSGLSIDGSGVLSASGGGGGVTIPSITRLLKGDGSGGVADAGWTLTSDWFNPAAGEPNNVTLYFFGQVFSIGSGKYRIAPSQLNTLSLCGQNGVGDVEIGTGGAGNLTVLNGTATLPPNLNFGAVPEYTDNAAAVSAGLAVGRVYRTGDNLKIVH